MSRINIVGEKKAHMITGDHAVASFNLDDPKQLQILLNFLGNRLRSLTHQTAPYDPLFDVGVSLADLKRLDKAQGGNGHGATTAWRVFRGLSQNPKGRLLPTRHLPADYQAGVLRLGLLAACSEPAHVARLAEGKAGLKSGQLWEACLKNHGLWLGMDTTVWLAHRRALM
jgi:hypothetical protein